MGEKEKWLNSGQKVKTSVSGCPLCLVESAVKFVLCLFSSKNFLFSRSFHLRAKVAFDDERGGVLRLRNDDRSRENRGKCVDKGYSCENLFSHHEIPNFFRL